MFVDLNAPPVPVPMKTVAGCFSTATMSEMRPPMLAGPMERQARSLKSLLSSVTGASARAADAPFPGAVDAASAGRAGKNA